jgi:glutathione S-transferase
MELAGDGRLGAPASVEQWNTLSEAALAEGRTRVVRSIYQNNDALEESIPAVFPKRMRPWLRPVARDAVRRLDKKYAHLVVAGSLRRALEALRAALSESGTGYVLDRFTYADIAMVVVLETVAPIAHTEPPLGPATRQCWSDAALADEFADLLRWREGLVASVGLRSSQFTASRQ